MANTSIDEGRRLAEGWSIEQRVTAERYLDPDSPIEDLFGELAQQTTGPGAMLDDVVAAGQVIYRNASRRIRTALCGDKRLRAYAGAENVQVGEGIALLAVVAAIVAPIATGLNSMLIAALVLRIGLRELCKGVW